MRLGISLINFFKKINHLIVTLRFSILFIFITLFISTALIIILVASTRFSHTVSSAAEDLMNYTSNAVLQQLTAGIKPVEIEGQFTADLITQGVLNEDNEAQFISYTVSLIKSLPLAVSAYWGNQYGDFIYSEKKPDGTIITELYKRKNTPTPTRTSIYRDIKGNVIRRISSPDLSYDPRLRPWYIQAANERKTIWTDVYLFHLVHDLGITTATPVIKNNQVYGVFGIDIDLRYLTQFVTHQKITPHGFSFIITKAGNLVVYSQRAPFASENVTRDKLINIHHASVPLLKRSFEKYQQSGKKKLTFSFDYQKKSYLITYELIPALAEYGWLVGVVAPTSDFTSDLDQMNLITLGISLFILMVGILLVSELITQIVRPIKFLVKETENIKHFELEDEIKIKSKIKEVIYLRDAIHSMKIGLKLFQRYIPKVLVKQLIESGEDVRVGGIRKQLAVFFSDIENFTSICEKTDPKLLMPQLCEYFEELSQIIIHQKGTLDKYIGDSIMAFWGAPMPDDNPCYHAANAAILCQSKLNKLNAKWVQEGKSPLITRIGIHTGDAIVGNLGSSERLTYTALGDTINIASRFEHINKKYKTKIIVSDAVYEQIKDRFVLRKIDLVVVKGRSKSSCIYELLSDDIEKINFDINTYREVFEKGFTAYQQQHWKEAIAFFKECLKIYPTDTIAPLFIDRCKHFKTAPPGAEWNGVWIEL